jgi:integrase/recombinase XerC
VAEGDLKVSLMDGMRPSAARAAGRRGSSEHLTRLLRTCEGRDFTSRRNTAIILLLVDTGMRRAECAGMTLDDLDLDQRIVWVLGKGRRPRALPIGRKTAPALDRYLRVRDEHRLSHPPHRWVGRNGPMTLPASTRWSMIGPGPVGCRRYILISFGTPSPPAGWLRGATRMS